ncbi:hypothetical protein DVH24_024454 [Malus domestica]|uniref:Uncharacterized protein n=1 Tax=Malus domestica TaxID=3750 RepID=A0A498JGU7_MALDO|nr:hypothetical protein DVH24_024454 [Malus domestica]
MLYEMALQDDISRLKVEVADKNGHVEAVNEDLDMFKLKYDMLMAEKNELNARAQTLMANVSSRDNQIQEMAGHLSRLQTEHEGLIVGSESARRLVDELKTRVEELQKEVKRQSVVISDGAEEKREVIRQLCFSLEHNRSGYQELRQAFTGHRQRLVLNSVFSLVWRAKWSTYLFSASELGFSIEFKPKDENYYD